MSRPSPPPSDDASSPQPGPSKSGIVMTPQGPMLRFENAVVEEV
jgi:hypothetical protein